MLDRRGFLRGAGAVAGLGGLPGWAVAGPSETAYVASGEDWVAVFTGRAGEWRTAGRIGSRAASAVCTRGGRLYVGCGLEEVEGRPGGAVEEFAMDVGGARWVGRQRLALFAAKPVQMAMSPGARWLAMGLADGGYNLLALKRDGSLGPVTAALRRVGVPKQIHGLRFAGEGILVSFDGERAVELAVSEDGALEFLSEGRGTSPARRFDEGLVRAMAQAGVGERPSVAYA